jgi:hypothetical protein
MANIQRLYRAIPWAWAAAWVLVNMGQVLSDVTSRPNRGLTAAYVLGFAGWAIGAGSVLRYLRRRYEADPVVIALSAAGWGAGAFTAVALSLFWADRMNPGFLGLILGPALGGAIGGTLTFPMKELSAPGAMMRASLRGALSWGIAFLVFQVVAFYAGYFLMILTVNALVPLLGNIWAKFPGWALPAGVGGFLAALLASRSLRRAEVDKTT